MVPSTYLPVCEVEFRNTEDAHKYSLPVDDYIFSADDQKGNYRNYRPVAHVFAAQD